MIKLIVNGVSIEFTTTIFPDGTSQVWKIKDFPADFDEHHDEVKILWQFENEAELFHVCQLSHLLEKEYQLEDQVLVVPYLPYGRQDKQVSNSTSFALHTFTDILYHANISRIETFDAHSSVQTGTYIESTSPNEFHHSIFDHDVVCFPDKGALTRYSRAFEGVPMIYCEKIRNQLNGEITGLEVKNPSGVDLNGLKILIIDDICDGGMTFIKVAEALKASTTPQTIDLAVSHGLFSKGKQCLYDAGINTIYTTNSLIKNTDGYKLW